MFWPLNSLNLAELVVNDLMKGISKKILQYSFFYSPGEEGERAGPPITGIPFINLPNIRLPNQ